MLTLPAADSAERPREGAILEPIIAFIAGTYVGDERVFSVSLGELANGSRMHPHYERPLAPAVVDRLIALGRCAGCAGQVMDLRTPCACGHRPLLGGHLEVTIADRAGAPSFDRLVGRMLDAAKSAQRRRRVAAVPCTLTAEEVGLLLTWQGGLCYYCAVPFPEGPQGLSFERDHALALSDGGATTLENTVLACRSCNARKGTTDAYTFSRMIARTLTPDNKTARKAMRQRLQRNLAAYVAAR